MAETPSPLAQILVARGPDERRRALEALAAEGPRALALVESALPDLARQAPEALPVAARLAALGARHGDPASARLLDLLARASSAEARAIALAALQPAEARARDRFALALEELAQGLAPSPLREKLARAALAPALAPDVAARAFAAAYEAARAAGDGKLLAFARERLAPTLEDQGLVAVFERAADEGAFDVRPASSASADPELGRPAVRSRAGAVVVRGVVFVSQEPRSEEPRSSAPVSDAELVALVRRGLEPGAAPSALDAARVALDEIEARLRDARRG